MPGEKVRPREAVSLNRQSSVLFEDLCMEAYHHTGFHLIFNFISESSLVFNFVFDCQGELATLQFRILH
jgi:hypothetical protein